MNKKRRTVLLLPICTLLTGCTLNISSSTSSIEDNSSFSSSETKYGLFTDDDYIEANGTYLQKRHGAGDKVTLKGTNAGGYLVTERWMCPFGFSTSDTVDHLSLTNKLVERFGAANTVDLWEKYRDYYWTDTDFDHCKEMGMNVIRLPFSYMNLDSDYNNVSKVERSEFNFSLLDSFISKASQRGIYTILDLHGAYGSQNGQDHSGQSIENDEDIDFYTNTENQNKTVHLWEEITKHYKGNPAIAGFDLLNEPGEHAKKTTSIHFDFFDKMNDAIRAIDQDRLLIFEACWDGSDICSTSTYGWTNCMYSFHHYSNIFNDSAALLTSYKDKIAGVEKMSFNVPLYMGEFNCYSNQEAWRSTLQLLNSKGWNYTSWTYKVNDINGYYTGWGIYNTASTIAYADTDSIQQMMEKWKSISSSENGESLTHLDTNKSLFDVMYDAMND